MYAGREAETGSTTSVFETPEHRYTGALLGSILRMETAHLAPLATIPGRPPDLTLELAGCPFAPRCPAATDQCRRDFPAVTADGGHQWRCHHPLTEPAPSSQAREASS
jgi:peptide/nickel transport system ATP-binding protein